MTGPRPGAVLLDLLMATMDSMTVWADAAGDRDRGLAWRDAVTERMIAAGRYVPYERLVADAAVDLGLDPGAPDRLADAWAGMRPWPDAGALARLRVPYAFVTNCSAELGAVAAGRSGLAPTFTLTAEEAGWYKPRPEVYRLACGRIGAPAPEVRFVAGAAYDAEGARRAGLDVRLVQRRTAPAELDPAVTIVRSLAEVLSGA